MDKLVIVLDLMHIHIFHCRFLNGEKNVVERVKNSPSRHTDKRKKNILILNEGLTGGLDDTTIMTEAKYSVNISKSRKKIC